MKIDGGCHCGEVSYAAEIDPNKVIICHCTDCQVMSGSAFRPVIMVGEADLNLSGKIKDYVKTSESGNPRAQGFCPECGTHIYATSVGDGPKVYNIRFGTSNQRNELTPKIEIWCDSALSWIGEINDTKKVPGQPG